MFALRFTDVGKKYPLESKSRFSLKDSFLRLCGRYPAYKDFWALRGINLMISKGESIGIVGRNGSGKTTLLKLLGRITKPTTGNIDINGKTAGILELGAGFHDDLNGEENIYLNGLVLGLSREQIKKNLGFIIEFADIGDFIYAPMRTYSAGMYLRLGFSVAVSLNPDILLIDEALAVGDSAFQEKCFYKIREFKEKAKTIIFVSHNTNIIPRFCDSAVWLEKGMIIKQGSAKGVVRDYEMFIQRENRQKSGSRMNSGVKINGIYFSDSRNNPKHEFFTGEKMIISIEYFSAEKIDNPVFGLSIFKDDGTHITGPNTKFSNFKIDFIEGRGIIDFIIYSLPFLAGNYSVSAAIHTYEDELEQYDFLDKLFGFKVISPKQKEKYGIISLPHKWRLVGHEL